MMANLSRWLLLIVAWTASANAQELPRTPVVFLEKAYFAPASPFGKKLIFEGQPTVHYFIWNRLSDQVWQRDGGWKFTLPVSANFQVRMSADSSNPVRTPSYQIRPLYMQAIHLLRPDSNRLAFQLVGIAGGFTHYSNGQAGCSFLQEGPAEQKEACLSPDASRDRVRVANVLNGDFSTTFASIRGDYRYGELLDSDDPVDWQVSVGAELQIHPLNFKPGGINDELRREWGQHQWSMNADFEWRQISTISNKLLRGVMRTFIGDTGVARVALLHEQRFGGQVAAPLNRSQIQLSYVTDRFENLGYFVRWHTGYDYYNIHFQNTDSFWAIGFMWDVARLDKLNTRPIGRTR
jgi:hypothetical protein